MEPGVVALYSRALLPRVCVAAQSVRCYPEPTLLPSSPGRIGNLA